MWLEWSQAYQFYTWASHLISNLELFSLDVDSINDPSKRLSDAWSIIHRLTFACKLLLDF